MPAITVGSVLLFLNIAVELLGSEEIQKRLGGLGNLKGQRLKDAWEEMSSMVASAASDKVSEDVYWRGDLLGSIDHEVIVEGDEISSIIFADEPYAPFQERGVEPYWPNIDALEDWAADHGLTGYAVARAISVTGLEAQWFFRDTLLELEEDIVGKVGQVITEIMEKEY